MCLLLILSSSSPFPLRPQEIELSTSNECRMHAPLDIIHFVSTQCFTFVCFEWTDVLLSSGYLLSKHTQLDERERERQEETQFTRETLSLINIKGTRRYVNGLPYEQHARPHSHWCPPCFFNEMLTDEFFLLLENHFYWLMDTCSLVTVDETQLTGHFKSIDMH